MILRYAVIAIFAAITGACGAGEATSSSGGDGSGSGGYGGIGADAAGIDTLSGGGGTGGDDGKDAAVADAEIECSTVPFSDRLASLAPTDLLEGAEFNRGIDATMVKFKFPRTPSGSVSPVQIFMFGVPQCGYEVHIDRLDYPRGGAFFVKGIRGQPFEPDVPPCAPGMIVATGSSCYIAAIFAPIEAADYSDSLSVLASFKAPGKSCGDSCQSLWTSSLTGTGAPR